MSSRARSVADQSSIINQSSVIRPPSIRAIDDDLFILYQWAAYYEIPVDYLYIINGKGQNVIDLTTKNIKSIRKLLEERILTDRSEFPMDFNPNRELSTLIRAKNELKINSDKAIMLYIDITPRSFASGLPVEGEQDLAVISNNEKLKETLRSYTNKNHLIILLGRLINLGRVTANDELTIELINELRMSGRKFEQTYYAIYKNYVYSQLRVVANLFYRQVNEISNSFSSVESLYDRYIEWKNRYEIDVRELINVVERIINVRQSIIESSPLSRSNFNVENITMLGSAHWNLGNWLVSNSIDFDNISNLLLQSDGRPIVTSDGYELFDLAIASQDVPYIKYNVGNVVNEEQVIDRTLSKVYYTETGYISADRQGRAFNEQKEEFSFHMDYENIVPMDEKSNDPDTMYLTVWLGEGVKSVAPKDSYTSVIYDISNNTVELEVDVKKSGDLERVNSKVYNALPLLVSDWQEGKMTGLFRIFNLEIEHYSFLYMVRIHREFSNYFYIEESDKPSAAKSQIYLHFQSPLSATGILKEVGTENKINYLEERVDIHPTGNVRVIFNQLYSATGDSFVIDRDGEEIIERPEPGTPYVQFKVQKIMSSYELQRLMTLMVHLMEYYLIHKDRIMNLNYDLVPLLHDIDRNRYIQNYSTRQEISPIAASSNAISPNNEMEASGGAIAASSEERTDNSAIRDRISTSNQTSNRVVLSDISTRAQESKNEILRNVASDIFIDNYATIVQRSKQPLPIADEDVPYWKNRTISNTDSRTHQVMEYPPGAVKPLNLICPDKEYPFPGLRSNTLDNKDQFPCIPNCYKKDQMNSPSSKYNICMNNWNGLLDGSVDPSIIDRKSKQRKEGHIVNIDKRVAPNRRGNLADHIVYLLKRINRDSKDVIYQRYGVKTSPSSIIHAIIRSMDAEAEYRAYTDDVREKMSQEGITNDYLTATDEERDRIVALMREDMASKINYDILRQENYDVEPNRLREILADSTIFLDPARYYRALEEYFTITLFTFVNRVRMPSSDRRGFEIKSNQLEIPRHSKYYVRRTRPPTVVPSSVNSNLRLNRIMILIFKFTPTVGRGRDLPAHCEFIVRGGTSNTEQLFGYFASPSMINGMFDLFYQMAGIYQWSIKPTCHISSLESSSSQYNAECNREGLIVERSLGNGDFINLRTKIQNSPIGVTISSSRDFRSSGQRLNFRSYGHTDSQSISGRDEVIDYRNYKERAIAQLIDDYGKCKGLLYSITSQSTQSYQPTTQSYQSTTGGYEILAMIPPTQPYNLPIIDRNNLVKPSFDQVNNYLASPITGVTYSEQKSNNFSEETFSPTDLESSHQYDSNTVANINGLWYSTYGRTYGVYIPIREETQNERLSNLPAGKRAPASVYSLFDSPIMRRSIYNESQLTTLSRVDRLVILNKMNNIILSILNWLFKLSNETVEEFINRLVVPTSTVDPLVLYNFDNLNYKYPNVSSFTEALTYIDQNSYGLIRGEEILLYNEKYYHSVTFFLHDMADNTIGLRQQLPLIIPGSYSRLTDFRSRNHNLIFLSDYDLKKWIRSRKSTLRNNLVLRTTLSNQMSSFINPYLYNDQNMRIYLVQNVTDIDIPIKQYHELIEANPNLDPEKLVMSRQAPTVPFFLNTQFPSGNPLIAEPSTSGQIYSMTGPLTVTGAKTAEQRAEETRLKYMLIARARALQVAITWRNKLINTGYDSEAYVGQFPSHVIYEIVEGRNIRLQENYVEEDQNNPYNLIAYTDGYAAMLPIA